MGRDEFLVDLEVGMQVGEVMEKNGESDKFAIGRFFLKLHRTKEVGTLSLFCGPRKTALLHKLFYRSYESSI